MHPERTSNQNTFSYQSSTNCVVEAAKNFPFPSRVYNVMDANVSSYSALASTAPSSYDRPNRLKGREEGIRWTELLEKFRNVQEKARRIQRPGELDDDIAFGAKATEPADTKAFKDLVRQPGLATPAKETSSIPVPAQTPVQKSKSGLGKFGRLGGAVSGSRPKR